MTHTIGMMRCAVCQRDTAQPIELRRWDNELDELIEAQVCSGDCAKAWIEGSDSSEKPAADEADEATAPPVGWIHEVEVAPGKRIRVRVSGDVDPATDADLAATVEMRTRVAYAQYEALLAERHAKAIEPGEAL